MPSNFYKYTDSRKTQKKSINLANAQDCHYEGRGSGIKKCLTNCTESDNKFHNVGSHECISKCVDSFSYHKAGGDECMI